ncbi:unnamed protein product, partial [marine sediment metagenome]
QIENKKRYKLHFNEDTIGTIQVFCESFHIELNKFIVNTVGYFLFFSFNSKLFIIERDNLFKIEHQLFNILTDVRSKFISTTTVELIKKVKKKTTIENKRKKPVQLNLFGKRIYYSDK